MTELLTAQQMRAIEQAAIASGSVTGLELMERAGRGVVEAIMDEWPELAKTSHKAVVLCGPGNNGGDGFVIARLLKKRGWDVQVFLYGEPDKLPPDARINYDRWCEIGEVSGCVDISTVDLYFEKFDVFVDALFGIGLKRELPKEICHWTFYAHDSQSDSDPKTVSVDVASGFCADSGRFLGNESAFLAKLVVTFHSAKVGHFTGDAVGYTCAPRVVVKDIGLEGRDRQWARANRARPTTPSCEKVRLLDAAHISPSLVKTMRAHKFSHGHALILSGPSGQTGAARLTARGALRIGAGVVTVGSPKSAILENASQLTAIMLDEIDGPKALKRSLEDERINALCLGPALGLDNRAAKLVDVALEAGRSTVLDADALTLLSQDESLFAKLHTDCVLTPHAGEFKRLFPDLAAKLDVPATTGPAYSKVDATRDAAKRAGCTVVFKGPDTVIASPNGQASINASLYERAAPWLATAGSGDVLAGFITGLLARGYAPHAAAEAGAYLHTECALSFGAGLIAEDLPEELPKVFTALGL
jgi:hydroxyethylthiazole kinase-like uncharacterized protein yjeF